VHTVSTAYNCHYAHLLLAELLYKNDYAQTNRTELLQAVAYFDSLYCCTDVARNVSTDIVFLDARAHYINGVGYYENDSAVEACAAYLKALEIMDERFGEKEMVGKKAKFMAMTYTRLTELFSDFYLHEQAICYAHQSMFYYKKQATSSWFSSWVLNKIGTHYDMMDELDSASLYYQQASVALNDTSIILYRDIAAHQAFLHYRQNSGRTESTMQQLRQLLSLSTNEEEKHARRLTIGGIFIREKQLDSAWQYLNMVYFETSNVSAKKQAAEWLVEICKEQGRDSEIIEYANYLVPFANQEENKSAVKSQLTEKYNTFRQNELEKKYIEEVRKNTKYILIVIGGLLVVLMTVIVLHLRRKKNLKTQLEAENHAHKMQQAALSGRLKRSNEELRELKDQIRQRNDAVAKTEAAASFTEEPVCRLILERVKEGRFKSKVDCTAYKDFALNKQQLLDLRLAADRHYDQFTVRLKKAYPELTQGDLDYCCLYLLGLTDADIAALMQRAYNTVIERNGKMRKIFGSENPLPITLKSITNGFSLA
jgi:tetratricopeptide (TPR) repeat protein